MTNLLNLQAETGADFISDDSGPGLLFWNSSTGPGMASRGAVFVSTVSIDKLNINPGVLAANATVVGLNFATPSVASGAVINLRGQAFVSAVSLIFAAGSGWAGMGAVRVVKSDGTFGWIPVLPNAQVTAAAVE